MFESLFGLVEDVAKITLAPVAIAIDLTRSVTKPIGELAEEAAKGIGEIINPEDRK